MHFAHFRLFYTVICSQSQCLLCRVEWCSLVPGCVLCCVVCRGRYCIIIKVSWWDCWGPATVTLNGFTLHSRHIFCCGSVATAGRSVLRLSGPLLILANIILRWLKWTSMLFLNKQLQRLHKKCCWKTRHFIQSLKSVNRRQKYRWKSVKKLELGNFEQLVNGQATDRVINKISDIFFYWKYTRVVRIGCGCLVVLWCLVQCRQAARRW